MRSIVQRIYAKPQYAQVLKWSKLLIITGGAQALTQAICLVGGILVTDVTQPICSMCSAWL